MELDLPFFSSTIGEWVGRRQFSNSYKGTREPQLWDGGGEGKLPGF